MKTITITKNDLVRIITDAFAKGLLEGQNSKKGQYRKKPYKRAKKFILDVYWYKKEK